jgi:hypothetical protein
VNIQKNPRGRRSNNKNPVADNTTKYRDDCGIVYSFQQIHNPGKKKRMKGEKKM